MKISVCKRAALYLFVVGLSAALLCHAAKAHGGKDEEPAAARATGIPAVGVDEHLNELINLELRFKQSDGTETALKDLLVPNRPLLIAPIYYNCTQVCTLQLSAMARLFNDLNLKLGRDLAALVFSIAPEETPETAARSALAWRSKLDGSRHQIAAWHFLTGAQEDITALSNQLGFRYAKEGDDYAHTLALVIVTPHGKIARYFYGVNYEPEEVRRALIQAGQGQAGSTVDRIILYCFQYDHVTGRYTPLVWNIVQLFSLGLLAALLILIAVLKYRHS